MNQEKQPNAIRLADEFKLCNEHDCLPSMNDIDSAAAELRRQHFALTEWFEKTEWVQKTVKPRELGMHRADILRTRIESLQAELATEAARTAEEKLRADQMTKQHSTQCDISKSAVATLVGLGYTDRGGEQWAPPIGKAPDFNLLDAANAQIAELQAQLSAIGAGGVESLRKREQAESVAWTPGPNEFKDWCSQWFGPDSDDSYLAKAVFNLPPMAQQFDRTALQAAPPAPAAVAVPEVGSNWRHKNGATYTVVAIANADAIETARYPITVVYRGPNGKVWARRAADWLRSMTPDIAPAQEHATQLASQGQAVPSDSEAFEHFVSDCDGDVIQYDSASYEAGFRTGRTLAAQERKPLTDEQIDELHGESSRGYDIEVGDYFKAFRDAEAAHGITTHPTGD